VPIPMSIPFGVVGFAVILLGDIFRKTRLNVPYSGLNVP
jgi:hypothetical protein